jgi:hypothetical protein
MRHSLYPLYPPLLARTAAWFRTAAFTGIVRGKGGTAPRTRPSVVKPGSLTACEGSPAQGCRMNGVSPDPQAGPARSLPGGGEFGIYPIASEIIQIGGSTITTPRRKANNGNT